MSPILLVTTKGLTMLIDYAPLPPAGSVAESAILATLFAQKTLLGLPVVQLASPEAPSRTPKLAARLRALEGPNPPRPRPYRNHYPPIPAEVNRRRFKRHRRLVLAEIERLADPKRHERNLAEWADRCHGGDAVRSGIV